MISGADLFCRKPSWYLGSQRMEISTELDVLGIIFTNDGKSEKHVHKRIQKCRQAFYSMSSSGMTYPGLPTDTCGGQFAVPYFYTAWKLFLFQKYNLKTLNQPKVP